MLWPHSTLRMEAKARVDKIRRLRLGRPMRVLDLFSGCGGLSLGSVELDDLATKSHAKNFFKGLPAGGGPARTKAHDITQIEPKRLLADLRLGEPRLAIDVIAGGPPCQAYARVGRAKLREIAKHPEAFLRDPRSNLYLRFLHYVKELQPLVVLIENVPDALNHGGHNIAEETCEALNDLGYEARYTLLNSVFYGVPQMRERMFLLAYAKELKVDVEFPAPTHWIKLPRGYEGTRSVALKTLAPSLFRADSYYVPPPEAAPSLQPAVTAREALEDLPRITAHLEGNLKRGTRRFNVKTPYPVNGNISTYAQLMRNWPGFECIDGISDHVIRSLPRDYQIFRKMNPGDQYPEAYEHAIDLFQRELECQHKRGKHMSPGSKEYAALRTRIVPPYDPGKFPNKWRKMEAERPSRTLMAHLGKDGYSHIHYDSGQARTISVREAARLQSFPDGFVFEGTMNPAFRQIGNAVPPLMAAAIAHQIRETVAKGRKVEKARA
jgi:DNA (cytosine-5)-methyltransferase 1